MDCSKLLASAFAASLASGCAGFPDTASQTNVVLDNRYAPRTASVIYDAHWLNASFSGQPVAPGASSSPQSAVPASADNTAYVVLAPGWDPTSTTPPASFVLIESRRGYSVALGDTLHIAVDDSAFAGNCAAGSHLTQDEASFLTRIVFAGDFTGFAYDPATCTTTPIGDAGAD